MLDLVNRQCLKQVDELLSLPQQMWLLGAGISKNAGIPLMWPLTNRVECMLDEDYRKIYKTIRGLLTDGSHVEHILSHIGDFISLVQRSKSDEVDIGGATITLESLRKLHIEIQEAIKDTIRWGYFPEENGEPERIGTSKEPVVEIDNHIEFVKALFTCRRSGLERRPPVSFFTTNYDTLLEDALALCRIPTVDGFSGGSMAFWDPNRIQRHTDRWDESFQARIYKLHGSIDWFVSEEDIVVRRREGAGYPKGISGRLLIYPQATKYRLTQKDPFASLFSAFRSSLSDPKSDLLVVCGYSFGDEHVNEEIERALKQRDNRLTVLAFIQQQLDNTCESLPPIIVKWLGNTNENWKERIIVVGDKGIYHGSLENLYPPEENRLHTWWTFEGVTSILKYGMGV